MKHHLLVAAFAAALSACSISEAHSQMNSPINQKSAGSGDVLQNTYYAIKEAAPFLPAGPDSWLRKELHVSAEMGTVLLNTTTDQLGFIHYRYRQTWKGIPIHDAVFIVHTKDNTIQSVNGCIITEPETSNIISITNNAARERALASVNAATYIWQLPAEEAMLKSQLGDSTASYFPTGNIELLFVLRDNTFHYTYTFDIYAHKPMSRQAVYVDAQSGEILQSLDKISTTNASAQAKTKYSGTRNIHTIKTQNGYFLRDSIRGSGIITLNMNHGISSGTATEFIDSDTIWENINPQQDEAATDAHWGAEMTYDYFLSEFGRKSLDASQCPIFSYVHFSTDYSNAFWDGHRVCYGDGLSPLTAFTSLDICGHELTHGVETYTANFDYYGESGALAEGFSDIFGTAIEFYAKAPTQHGNWLIGEDAGITIRNISNPKSMHCPDTYKGHYWDAAQQVHKNSTVLSHWFYMLCAGDSGINESGNSFSITGIGMEKAAAIAYRTMTVYLIHSSGYSDARYYSILAANELYGSCSNEVKETTNAWNAAGVGDTYISGVTADFVAQQSHYCTPPAIISFTNYSVNASSFTWIFGDGSTSNLVNPTTSYAQPGSYTVTLIADGGGCGSDTLSVMNCISIYGSNASESLMPQSGVSQALTCCQGTLYDSGGQGNYQDFTNGSVTIAPTQATSVLLTFTLFDFADTNDVLFIYDGPNTASPLIGKYTGNSLTATTIQSSGSTITLRQRTNERNSSAGFKMNWQCNQATGTAEPKASIQQLSFYPNPATDVLNIVIATKAGESFSASIIDITGKEVEHRTETANGSSSHFVFDISDLNPGVYFVESQSSGEREVKKLIKK
ncbi:MAG: M4 family metallopeptidase [Bacteroidota bacterium]